MIRETMEIGVLVEYRKLKNPWIDHAWMPSAVLVGAPAAAPWTVLDATPQATRYYAGPFQLEFFRTDTGSYRDNLGSARPCIWVSLRPSDARSEEHTSELQSLMRTSYAGFRLKKHIHNGQE